MKQKNFDSDVIPAEQVVLLEKHILEELKKLRADSVEEMKNVRTESERKRLTCKVPCLSYPKIL